MKTIGQIALWLSVTATACSQETEATSGRELLLEALAPFRLAEPWESLADAPAYVTTHRGAAAYVAGQLSASSVKPENRSRIVAHFELLRKNQKRLIETARQIDQDDGAWYRESRKFDVLRFLVALLSEGRESFYFSASGFNDVYYSLAEGRAQSFQVVLPPGYSATQKYPLFVQVFGSTTLMPTVDRPFIRVRPNGRGVWGFRSMSRYDVLQVIAQMEKGYSVDSDRIYMTGSSAGATGMMHTAACRTDMFAGVVPLVAFGMDLPLANFCNLPVRCEHGVNDWTSAICNVRVQFLKLDRLGYDAALHAHPTAGHGIRVPPPLTMDWLFLQKRNPSTTRIVHTCEHPRDGRAYWLRIETFVDPHRIARVEANAVAGGITVTTDNVRRIAINMDTAPFDSSSSLVINTRPIQRPASDGWHSFETDDSGNWIAAPTGARTTTQKRSYGAGAAANLFQGDPLLVVYGTGGDEPTNTFLRQAASVLARSGGPTFKPAGVRFRMVSDAQVPDLSLQKYNVLLVGTPDENSYLRGIADDLPWSVNDSVLDAGGRERLKLDGAVLSAHHFNPAHPDRIVYVVSPYLNAEQRPAFLKNPRLFLAGGDGFKMIDQPDLLVRGVDLRIRREMQFGHDWKFSDIPGADERVPEQYADRTHLAIAHMQVMHQTEDVDFALWWGPEDKGAFGGYDFNWLPTFDPAFYTRADYLVRKREVECMTGSLPGSELLDVYNRWIDTGEIISLPKFAQDDIDASRNYRIAIPMDLVVKLGNRRKTLSDVAPARPVMPQDVAGGIFPVKE